MRTFARRRTQVVREQSAKLRCGGSNPPGASNFLPPCFLAKSQSLLRSCARRVWLSDHDCDRMTGALQES